MNQVATSGSIAPTEILCLMNMVSAEELEDEEEFEGLQLHRCVLIFQFESVYFTRAIFFVFDSYGLVSLVSSCFKLTMFFINYNWNTNNLFDALHNLFRHHRWHKKRVQQVRECEEHWNSSSDPGNRSSGSWKSGCRSVELIRLRRFNIPFNIVLSLRTPTDIKFW